MSSACLRAESRHPNKLVICLFQDPSVTQMTHSGDHMHQYQPFPDNNSVSIHKGVSNISHETMSESSSGGETRVGSRCAAGPGSSVMRKKF